ncbi:MAG TPA: glycosyltransferase [Acidimicrobiales bacterium]|jgi:glycosyltransferase involved in cell wall biosynthesis/GT2 family glycosyltransferase|nr:glycosyltransferase [Acidimicrobiales bacterium]
MNVDVVIVTYRSEALLPQCLESVPRGTNVIVVDNASGDKSAVIARKAGATVIENSENVGFAAAANQGAAAGDNPYVLFLNPDAVLQPGCVEALERALNGDPDAAIAGPRLVLADRSGEQRVRWPFPSAARSWAEAIGLSRLLPTTDDASFLVGACLLVRRSALEAVDGFDEEFWLYGEEADLTLRLRQRGFGVLHVAEAECSHIGGASGEGSDRSFDEFQLGTERFLRKHRGRGAVLSHRLALLVGSALRVVVLTLLLRGSTPTACHRRRVVRRLVRVLVTGPLVVRSSPRKSSSVVVLSLEPWDDVWRRNQFLVRELLAADSSLRVLFVEPPVDILHHLLRTRRLPSLPGLRKSDHDERLLLFTPVKALPRALGPWADRDLVRQLKRVLSRCSFEGATLWVNDPAYAQLARWRMPLVYDLTDDWTKADRPPRQHRRLVEWDRTLTTRANVVTACSDALAASHSNARDLRVILNGVDVDHFRARQERPADLPTTPVATYVGTLHEDRLDIGLVTRTARALPQIKFVFVGPCALGARARNALEAEPNVILLGQRPYEVVPSYLQHSDVIVIPHVTSEFTATLDPIKAYECMAVGTPTVATPVVGFVGAGPPIHTAPVEDFAAAVADAIGMTPAPRGDVPTWRSRGIEFQRALLDARRHVQRRRLQVAYVNHCARLSGGELALVRLLPALDVEAHVILGEDGPLVDKLRQAGASVEIIPMAGVARDLHREAVRPTRLPFRSLVATATYTFRLARRLRELRPDLVHTNSLKAAIYGCVAARLASLPVIAHIRDRIASDYLPRFAVGGIRVFLRFVPDAVVTNSATTLRTLHLPASRTAVVSSPVIHDIAVAPSRPADHSDAPGLHVAMVGRIAPWKGQDVFLRGFAAAFDRGRARGLIVGAPLFGEDEFEREIRALADDLGISDEIEFLGFRDDVDTILADVDILVHASTLPEPFGQVVVEGMAAGVAVVASSEGGPAEVVTDSVDGLLVPPNDVAALATALQRLTDATVRRRLSTAARARAADFAPAVIARQVEAVYDGVRRRRVDSS